MKSLKFLLVILFSCICFNLNAEESDIKLKSEDQIPLKIESSVQTEKKSNDHQKLFLSLAVIVGLLGGSYLLLRRFSFKNTTPTSQMQIKILTQHFLGPKKSLAVIRVAGESILIGVTDQNISMIKALSLLDEEIPKNMPADFNSQLTENMNDEEVLSQEDFAFAGLKTTVADKLKNLRNFQ